MPPVLPVRYPPNGRLAHAVFAGDYPLLNASGTVSANGENCGIVQPSQMRSLAAGAKAIVERVVMILGRRKPFKVSGVRVSLNPVSVIGFMTRRRTRWQKCGGNKQMHTVAAAYAFLAECYVRVSPCREVATRLHDARASAVVSGQSAHSPKVADLVQTLVTSNRTPLFHASFYPSEAA